MADYNKKLRVLEITTSLSGGGTDRLLYNYCSRINGIDFDFMIVEQPEGILEQPLIDCGFRVFRVAQFRKKPFGYIFGISKLLYQNHYDVVHSSWGENGIIPIFFAWLYHVRVRISHAHIAYTDETRFQRVKRYILSWLVSSLSTDLFACTEDAGKWVWCASKKPVKILKNAIETERYSFSPELRSQYRREFGVVNQFVIGDVGRLAYQKNPEFMLEIFKCILQICPASVLLMIGDGVLDEKLKELANQLEITDKVIFTGVRADVPQLMSMMDVFVLPTRFEGLGIVYIEAQANGLPTFASANVVPHEIEITDLVRFISLEQPAEYWATEILKCAIREQSNSYMNDVVQAGYDIENEAGSLKDWYMKHGKKNDN